MSNDERSADQQQDIYETPSGTPDFKTELAAPVSYTHLTLPTIYSV